MSRRRLLQWLLALIPAALLARSKEETMSFIIHRADERGSSELGWLSSRFSFSFAEYHNPDRMGFGVLRVINDDTIKAGTGFGMHPHRDMEIITIVTQGAIEHRDSQGNHGITRAGEIQYMCAGTGVQHSEHAAEGDDTRLFQVWIFPDAHGYTPRYEQRDFRSIAALSGWHTLISGDGRENSILIHQDAAIKIARIKAGESLPFPAVTASHGALLMVVEGKVSVADALLQRRDELQITDAGEYTLSALEDSEVLLFEVPMHR